MSVLPQLLLICFFSSLLSLGMLLFVRRFADPGTLREHHLLTDPLLCVVGTLFSVMMGFMVSGAMNSFAETRTSVFHEANYLADIFRLARGLPQTHRLSIRAKCRQYNDEVMRVEWPAMTARQMDPHCQEIYRQLWDQILSVKLTDQRESNIHALLLTSIQGLGDSRRHRMSVIVTQSSGALWAVIVSGAFLIMCFVCLFSIEKFGWHALMTVMVANGLCLNLFLYHTYTRPFQGSLGIAPLPFQVNTEPFKQEDGPPPELSP